MSELPIATHAVMPSMQIPGRDNASRPNADELAETDTPAGAPASFAATLKSLAGQKPTTSTKEEAVTDTATPIAEPATLVLIAPATPEASKNPESPTTPSDSSALLSLLQAGTDLPQALVFPAITLALPLTSASKPTVTPAGAASPAPTFPLSQGSMPNNALGALPSSLTTDITVEDRAPLPKLTAGAASFAESLKETPANVTSNQPQETFNAIVERITNHSAAGFAHSPTTGTSALSPALDLPVAHQLGQTAWRDEVGQKLTWMISNNQQQAALVLNPPQLGRIEVTLALDGNQASATFVSPHAAVREALENSMTRLREVLADAGVTLGQTHVGSESRRDSNPMNPQSERVAVMHQDNGHYATALNPPGSGFAARDIRAHGMVDVFV